jgi:hypothetical protein
MTIEGAVAILALPNAASAAQQLGRLPARRGPYQHPHPLGVHASAAPDAAPHTRSGKTRASGMPIPEMPNGRPTAADSARLSGAP